MTTNKPTKAIIEITAEGELFVQGSFDAINRLHALIGESEKLRKDAERYRWLKPHLYVVDTYSGKGISYEVGIDGAEVPDIDDVTEAIDAAMQGGKP